MSVNVVIWECLHLRKYGGGGNGVSHLPLQGLWGGGGGGPGDAGQGEVER